MQKIFDFLRKEYHLLAQILLAFSLTGGLMAFAYLGFFSRYGADDYCFTRALFRFDNLFQAAWWWYIHTSNRYTTMFLVGMSEWFGRSAISYLPALAILLWTVGLTLALVRASAWLRFPRPQLTGFVLAALSIFFTLWQAPNRYQSLYWRAGLVTYLTPLIFFSYLAWLLLNEANHSPRGRRGMAAISMLIAFGFFAAGGLSETTLAMQIGALSLSLASILAFGRPDTRKRLLPLLLVALLASLLALLVVFLAPANQFRLRVFGEPPPLTVVILRSMRFAWDFMYVSVKSMPLPTLVTLVSAIALGWLLGRTEQGHSRRSWFAAGVSILSAYALIVCAMAPSVYGQGSYPGARSLIGAQFVLVLATLGMGLSLGWGLRLWRMNRPAWVQAANGVAVIVLVLSIVYTLRVTSQVLALERGYQRRAVAWDARDLQIRQAVAQGARELMVEELDSIAGIREYSTQNQWVNRCAAEFYGLDLLLTYP